VISQQTQLILYFEDGFSVLARASDASIVPRGCHGIDAGAEISPVIAEARNLEMIVMVSCWPMRTIT
jgi:hypothetical protein